MRKNLKIKSMNIFELSMNLKTSNSTYIENGPPGPNRLIVLYDFCYKSMAEASEFFFKTCSNELYL